MFSVHVQNFDITILFSLVCLSCTLPSEVPHSLAESLAPTAKDKAKEQMKPKRRMGVPGCS